VVTCAAPWEWDRSCTTASATDNRTASHSAPCLGADCNSAVDRLYQAMGGSRGSLGALVSKEQPVRPTGTRALYRHGAIYHWGDHVCEVHGDIWSRYQSLGAQTGFLGLPESSTITAHDKRCRYSNFQYGTIYYTPTTGAHELHGALRDKWRSLGSGSSRVGYPTSDTRSASWGNGRYNEFERGAIYYRPGKGAWEVHGAIYDKWKALGRERSLLNFPTSDTRDASWDRGRFSRFDTGAIYYRPGKGAWEVHGAIYDKWNALGRERSLLNFPTSDTKTSADGVGRYGEFDTGVIISRPGKGTFEVHGALFDKWHALGREAGSLGYPTSDTLSGGGGTRISRFEHGELSYDPVTRQVTVTMT
jgi:uncharacterized protein with LGFP repeats